MKNFKKILVALVVTLSIFGFNEVKAASASLAVTASSSTVIVGNSVTVYVTLSSASALGSWDFTLGYSSNLRLTYSNMESGGTRAVNVVNSSGETKKTYTLKFSALSSGSASVYVNDYTVYDFNASLMSVSTSDRNLTLKTWEQIQASYSSNNALSSLTVDGYELEQEFNKDNLEYSVTLPPETPTVTINASVEDSTASLIGTGTFDVEEGTNNLNLVVTAQNGTVRTYTLNVIVEEYDPIDVEVDGVTYRVIRKRSSLEAPNNYIETETIINDIEVPAYESDITNYVLVGLRDDDGIIDLYIYEDDSYSLYKEVMFSTTTLYPIEFPSELIPENYTRATVEVLDETLEVYKYKDVKDFYLLYAVNVETGLTNIYTYNETEGTVQIYNEGLVKDLQDQIDLYYKILLISSMTILAVLFIIIVILIIKTTTSPKKKKVKKGVPNLESTIEMKPIKKENINKVNRKDKRKQKKLAKQEKIRLQDEQEEREYQKKIEDKRRKKLEKKLKKQKKSKKNKDEPLNF